MDRPFSGIDHAVVAVRDLDAASANFERLGFLLTPKGEHPDLGSQNRCVIMHGDYIELLSPGDHPQLGFFRDFLAEREGMAALAARSPNIVQSRAALQAQKFAVREPLSFGRPVTLPDGDTQTARFSVALLDDGQTEGFTLFGCQHHDAALIWAPGYEKHPNQAERISAVLFAAEDAPTSSRLIERFFDSVGRGGPHSSVEVKTGDAPIFVIPTRHMGDRYPGVGAAFAKTCFAGLSIQVHDLKETARVLTANGVPFRGHTALHLVVPPDHANGIMLEFYQNTSPV